MATDKRTFIEGVRGKIIDKITTGVEEDQVFIDLHFLDTTSCVIYVGPATIAVDSAEVLGWKDGNSHVIRKLL